ncbi:U1 small nuclear ribonucleoprotein 70 kDa, putative [Entamoeba invadens IP1]|uniref:U1 small nuclear ribonucleoprotein 70 kDa, putative n=1 Tax=Entamoeba invadens IP1 TaxID=370355 RepID=A0A0A1U684_ENTIV|nr:U1 small nuclear ribonucleoprotein 70 kDa, putative [Entamoeba invadens IP1]ELP89867.1 U1 small nuclear ribonucleoprotein 70 kDa, putative [Entamoeba invadens IP1]|eukprot:XP_004256638.1 U1 small nuclear ribonucleoprotein 70 kDa, putative [Entamoeba invadens IP1]
MVSVLPKNLQSLFIPNEPIATFPPQEKKFYPHYSGISDIFNLIKESPPDEATSVLEDPKKPFTPIWTKSGLKALKEYKKRDSIKALQDAMKAEWNPTQRTGVTDNPNRTVFVRGVPKDVEEGELKNIFWEFGDVKNVIFVKNKKGKRVNYCFVEFVHHSDAERAARRGDLMRIGEKRVNVEMERGRVDDKFLPTKIGGVRRKAERERRRSRSRERDFGRNRSEKYERKTSTIRDARGDGGRMAKDMSDRFEGKSIVRSERSERKNTRDMDRRDDRPSQPSRRDDRRDDRDRYDDRRRYDDRLLDDSRRDDRRRYDDRWVGDRRDDLRRDDRAYQPLRRDDRRDDRDRYDDRRRYDDRQFDDSRRDDRDRRRDEERRPMNYRDFLNSKI